MNYIVAYPRTTLTCKREGEEPQVMEYDYVDWYKIFELFSLPEKKKEELTLDQYNRIKKILEEVHP